MKDIAAFASSDAGKTYGRVCELWGVDPAASLEDDVLAANLRLALAVTMNRSDEPDDHADMVERTKRGGEQIRRALG